MISSQLENLLEVDLLQLLTISNSSKKFFFQSKDKSITVLALGPTEEIRFNNASIFLEENQNHILWSALSFEKIEEGNFNSSYLTLINRAGKTTAFINPNIKYHLQDLFLEKEVTLKTCQSSTELQPDFQGWQKMLKKALVLLETSDLQKIVLKRKKIIHFEEEINAVQIFNNAYKTNSETYNIYTQNNDQQAFISFSPEKLFSLEDNLRIETISLAGSMPRSDNPLTDQLLSEELLNSTKLALEQNIVTEEICNRLSKVANNVILNNLEIMKLRYIQHRSNNISANLNSENTFLDLIKILHPTPAVGGAPNQLALSSISTLEEDHRDHYAAPIGFVSSKYSEWAVGLRSAFIDKKTLTIYAGCGIVPGSVPKDEWDETENKMRPFINITISENIYV